MGPRSGYRTDAVAAGAQGAPEGTAVRLAGRVVLWRRMGGLIFGHLQDRSGRVQISLSRDDLGAELFKEWSRAVKIGDFIGVTGSVYTTRLGERTVAVSELTVLNRTVRALPDKWQGLLNVEARYRRRYLDLLVNADSRERFQTRAKIIQRIRAGGGIRSGRATVCDPAQRAGRGLLPADFAGNIPQARRRRLA
jgi:lysyl-tRNA synthetase class 2